SVVASALQTCTLTTTTTGTSSNYGGLTTVSPATVALVQLTTAYEVTLPSLTLTSAGPFSLVLGETLSLSLAVTGSHTPTGGFSATLSCPGLTGASSGVFSFDDGVGGYAAGSVTVVFTASSVVAS